MCLSEVDRGSLKKSNKVIEVRTSWTPSIFYSQILPTDWLIHHGFSKNIERITMILGIHTLTVGLRCSLRKYLENLIVFVILAPQNRLLSSFTAVSIEPHNGLQWHLIELAIQRESKVWINPVEMTADEVLEPGSEVIFVWGWNWRLIFFFYQVSIS